MGIRVVPANVMVWDQLDFFQGDFFTRVTGIVVADLTLTMFVNNAPTAWTLVTGAGVTDAQVRPGRVYLDQLASGYYGIRMKFNSLGYWRLDFRYAAGVQAIALDYDVVNVPDVASLGLRASFSGRP